MSTRPQSEQQKEAQVEEPEEQDSEPDVQEIEDQQLAEEQDSEPDVQEIRDQQLEELLHRHRQVIEAEDHFHIRQDVYNIRLHDGFTVDNLIAELRNIYNRQRSAFKVNLNFSFVLRNVEMGS